MKVILARIILLVQFKRNFTFINIYTKKVGHQDGIIAINPRTYSKYMSQNRLIPTYLLSAV